MIQRTETHIFPHPAEALYHLVLDVEKYPEFLPWCRACKIRENRTGFFIADLAVGYKFFRETLRSRVSFIEGQKISVEYLSGPFHHLKNEWIFTPLSSTETQVDFMIDFAFKNSLLQKAIQPLFDMVFDKMLSAFSDRARSLKL